MSNEKQPEWGEEVLPGVYICGTRNKAATTDPRLSTSNAQPPETDLAQIYERIDDAVDLIEKLTDSNKELLKYFLPKEDSHDNDGDDDDDEAGVDDVDSGVDGSSPSILPPQRRHRDPAAHHPSSSGGGGGGGGGGCDSMDALLALAEQENNEMSGDDEEEEGGDEEEKHPSSTKKVKKSQPPWCSGEQLPPADVMAKLPEDIRDALRENVEIINEKKQEAQELLTFTAARQHKCGAARHHGHAHQLDEEANLINASNPSQ